MQRHKHFPNGLKKIHEFLIKSNMKELNFLIFVKNKEYGFK